MLRRCQILKDFKAFILRGNVVDLAVGVVIGAAFATVVTALVEGIFTPLLAIPGETNFGDLSFTIGGGEFMYGNVINAIISFLVIAVAVFFFVVKPVNALLVRLRGPAEEGMPDEERRHRELLEALGRVGR